MARGTLSTSFLPLIFCLFRSLFDLRKAGTWPTGSVPLATWSVQPRPRKGCGRSLRWPLGLASRSAKISVGGAVPFSEIPKAFLPFTQVQNTCPLPNSTLIGLHAEGSHFQFPPAQDCTGFPSPKWWSVLPSSLQSSAKQACAGSLLLPWSRGGALAPCGLPQRTVTHQHFIYFWLTGAC